MRKLTLAGTPKKPAAGKPADAPPGAGCCGCLSVVLFNGVFGGVCFDYAMWFWLGRDVPFWADFLCGFFAAPVAVPAAVVGKICWLAGMPAAGGAG